MLKTNSLGCSTAYSTARAIRTSEIPERYVRVPFGNATLDRDSADFRLWLESSSRFFILDEERACQLVLKILMSIGDHNRYNPDVAWVTNGAFTLRDCRRIYDVGNDAEYKLKNSRVLALLDVSLVEPKDLPMLRLVIKHRRTKNHYTILDGLPNTPEFEEFESLGTSI